MNYSTPITPPSTGGGTGTVNKITFNGVEFLPDPTGNVPIEYQGFSGAYEDLTGKPVLFSGSYIDLTDKPIIPTVPTNVSAFTNDAGYLDAADIAPVGLSGNYADLINKPDLSPLATAVQNASNVGTGTSLVSGKTGTNLDFRTLRAGDNVTLSVNAQGEIVIASAGGGTVSGEANTSSSLGTGVSLVAPKNGVDLPFRSLLSSAGLTWSQETDTVTITLHSILQAWANLTLAADTLVYATGAGTLGTTPLTAFARTLLDDANAAAMQNTLALALVASSGSYADLSNKPLIQTSTTDTTAGALMAVGAFGVGKPIRVNADLGVLDLNSLTTPGTYWLDGGIAWVNSPFNAGILVVTGIGGFVQQEALHYVSGSKYVRTLPGNGVWSAWQETWHTGNFNPATKQNKSSIVSTATTRTLALTDAWNYIRPGTSSAITLTVPTNASVAFEYGTEITIRASGSVTIAAASGVTILAPANGTLVLAARMTAVLKKVGADVWDLIGQTVAA